MYLKVFAGFSNNKKLVFRLLCVYLFIGVAIFAFFAVWAKDDAKKQITGDMDTILTNLSAQISSVAEKNSIDAKNLAINTSIKTPMVIGVGNQIRSYCESLLENQYTNLKNFLIIDSKGTVVFSSNNSLFTEGSPSHLKMQSGSYMRYYLNDSIYILYYYPIIYENGLSGAVVYICDMTEFSKFMLSSIKGKKYYFYGISGDEILFLSRNGEIDKVRYSMTQLIPDAAKIKTIYLLIDNKKMLLSVHRLNNGTKASGGAISLGISKADYNSYRLNSVFMSLPKSLGLLVLLIFVSLLILMITQSFIYRSIQTKLQIQNLRVQKHDFLKHLNIINGLIKCNEIGELEKYIDDLSGDMVILNEIGKLGRPAVGVLISQKEKASRQNGIEFSVRSDTNLSNLSVSDYDLCTILANLLDNAIEASLEIERGRRKILLEIMIDESFLVIRVSNTGKPISDRNIDKIFKYGYTTKRDRKNHGMGLYIVMKKLKKYGGGIEVDHENATTTFSVCIPQT